MNDSLKALNIRASLGSQLLIEIAENFWIVLQLQIPEVIKLNDKSALSNIAFQKILSMNGVEQHNVLCRNNNTGEIEKIACLTTSKIYKQGSESQDNTDQAIMQIELFSNNVFDGDIYRTFQVEDDLDGQVDSNSSKFEQFIKPIIYNKEYGRAPKVQAVVSVLRSDFGRYVKVLVRDSEDLNNKHFEIEYIFKGKLINPGYYSYRLYKIRVPQNILSKQS